MDARLAELAGCHGIQLAYHDIRGVWREASEEVVCALLAAMGVAAATSAEVEAALTLYHRVRWRTIVPAAIVVRESALHDGLRMRLPAALEGRVLHWQVKEECGRIHSADFDARTLTVAEEAHIDGERIDLRVLPLPPVLPPGYHKLELSDQGRLLATADLIVAPQRCYQPEPIASGGRLWGGAVQLYGLRSERNWGIGDFTDLRAALELWAGRGAAVLGVNPLHALYLNNPLHISPYSPSSRSYVNVLYLDVEAIADCQESATARDMVGSAAFRAELQRLRDTEFVDYAGVAAVKRPLLEMLYAHFRSHHLADDTARARSFREYCAAQGAALERHAIFEALQEHLQNGDPNNGAWQQWPEHYRDPDGAAVNDFARAQRERVEFYAYLQWQADLQLAGIEQRCFELGLSIGLYADLAVSVDRGGAEAWAHQSMYALGASVGAPPDDFNLLGQDWGLPPLVPERLAAASFAPLIAALRANMAHAGALRIDHVMGLARLYWVPCGVAADQGAYVIYPYAEALGILALESQRHRCLVIGEDLGTVPPEVRATLHSAGVLSYRVLMFERDGGQFKAPADYPGAALVVGTTHDLPTLAGYWQGRDMELRDALGLFPNSEMRDAMVNGRAHERAALLTALERAGLLPATVSAQTYSESGYSAELAIALHVYMACSAAALMVVQFEDVLGVLEQANLPGTVHEYPNWLRKLPLALERWSVEPRFCQLAAAVAAVRAARQTPRPPHKT